jgi:WD40 repeat protein
MSEPSVDHDPFESVADAFLAQYRAGESPSIAAYAARHPELADRIRRLLPALVRLERDLSLGADAGPAARPPAAERSRRLGDYQILGEIGRGGMGVVYEAEQVSLGRRVALKVLPHLVAQEPRALARFRREAQSAARLHHTNIVPVFEVGQDGETAYYAMQFIEGRGLDRVIAELARLRARGEDSPAARVGPVEPAPGHAAGLLLTGGMGNEETVAATATADGPSPARRDTAGAPTLADPEPDPLARTEAELPPIAPAVPGGADWATGALSGRGMPFFRGVAQLGRQAAQGLAYAHQRGVLHRDIKPSNLLLDGSGVVWIADFGLAKGEDDGLTQTGDILGTLRYMAPERFRGEGDARADIYALGLTLYEILTLRPAYKGGDRARLVERIKTEEPPRPRALDPRIPRDLETIVLKAIEKDPSRRYATAAAMAEDLRRFLADEPILARRATAAERYWRWARRNPTIAILGGVLTGVLVLATAASLLVARRFWAQAAAQSTLAGKETAARRKADAANARLRVEEEKLLQAVYATRSNLALAAWDDADVRRLRHLLDMLRPAPGEPDRRGWEWRYLWQLDHEGRLTIRDETDGFLDLALSPDGTTIAGLERGGRIRLWDRRTGTLRRTTGVAAGNQRAGLDRGINAVAFRPDGRALVGPGPGEGLVLYSVEDGREILRFEGAPVTSRGAPRTILDLAWSPDGRTLVAALASHVMQVWDAGDGRRVHEVFGGHGAPVAAVAFSPDGRTLASASFDRTVKVWDLEDKGKPRAVLRGHTDEVCAVAFSPDGRWIASAGRDRTLRIWESSTGRAHAVIRGHTGSVFSLAYLPDGARIATGSADGTVRLWDADSGRELRAFKGHLEGVIGVAVSPDAREIVSLSVESARSWDADSPPRPLVLQSPSVLTYGGDVECLAYSPDGRRLASGHTDHALRIWDLPPTHPPRVLTGHDRNVTCVAFSPDGRVVASGGNDGTVRLWDADTGESRLTFHGQGGRLRTLVFTPDGRTILAGGFDRSIRAWDAGTGALRYALRVDSDAVYDLAFSPDGRTLAAASDDATCILWDFPEGRARLTLRGHEEPVNKVGFSPDGRVVATASDDRTVRLWDARDGAPLAVLEGHDAEVKGLAFNPDGRLATSGVDKTIRLWDCASGQTLLVLKGHAGPIRGVRFSPDGRTLASASDDRTVNLWDAAPADVLAPPAGGASAGAR